MKILFSSLTFIAAISIGCQRQTKIVSYHSLDFDIADSLYKIQNDSAFFYFNKAIHNSGDSLEIARAYLHMALIQSTAGDYFGGQENAILSQQYLNQNKANDQPWIPYNYSILGSTSLNLKQYDSALVYYDRAIRTDAKIANHAYYLNSKAVAYQKLQQYDSSISIYRSILQQHPDSIANYAMILSNFARSKWLKDSSYPATAELWTALHIRKTKEDRWGLNASYSHLADYYSKTRKDSALFYARQMYRIAISLKSAVDELEALDKIIRFEDPAIATKYFIRYSYLNDSIQQARNSAKNQFALIRFDAEKSKADNLVLQQENLEKKTSINRQRLIIFGVLFIFVSLSIIARLWYRKRKQRFLLQSEHAVKEQQLKTSKKVHDVVANGLYRIMMEIEHKDIGKERLLDGIEVLYEKSRDISYETSSQEPMNYEEKVNDLLTSFSNKSLKILTVGNNEHFWKPIPMSTKNELEFILQELMINMKKHSQAKNVVLKFNRELDFYHIRYTDDGIGISTAVIFGNGLKNTETRIHIIGGTINFEDNAGKGLKIDISFPKNTNDN